jgi:hypothetical protein
MCIIIDACCANSLVNSNFPQAKLILDWVKAGGKVVSGGDLERELKSTVLQRLLLQWSRSGRLISFDRDKLKSESDLIDGTKTRSNDHHVLALTRASGSKVVVTRDQDLMHDLKKSGQVPKGQKVYPFPVHSVTNLRVHRALLRNAGCK